MIRFYDDDHKSRYEDLMQRMAAADWDANRSAFAYLVTLDSVCRDHILDLYDFEDGCIHSDALAAAWQTGTRLMIQIGWLRSNCSAVSMHHIIGRQFS